MTLIAHVTDPVAELIMRLPFALIDYNRFNKLYASSEVFCARDPLAWMYGTVSRTAKDKRDQT